MIFCLTGPESQSTDSEKTSAHARFGNRTAANIKEEKFSFPLLKIHK